MASFRFCLLSALICGVVVLAKGEAVTTEKPVTITVPTTTPENTDTPLPTEVTTTEPTPSPNTTTSTTTTTTTPKTTTSTTTASTTTTSTTTTTTTTTAPPPPPAPTPSPPKPTPGPPQQGTWSFKDEKNVTCIVVQFAGQLNVSYPMTKNNKTAVGVMLMNIPANATVTAGSCGDQQNITLSWPATVDLDHTLTIHFQKNDSIKSYQMKGLNVSLVPSVFPNITNVDSIDLYHGAEWWTPLAASYRCAAPTKLTLTAAEAVNIASTLTLSQLQEEAYRTAPGKGFSAPRNCGGDIPDVVPIAVGCALGGMVLVVLVAYLVARRRSAARGYLSM